MGALAVTENENNRRESIKDASHDTVTDLWHTRSAEIQNAAKRLTFCIKPDTLPISIT